MKSIFAKMNQYLFFIVLIVIVLYFGKSLLIPIFFAVLLSMLMAPLCRKLDSKGFNRALSTLCCVLILLSVVIGMFSIVGAQFAAFSKDVSGIKEKGKEILVKIQEYVEEKSGMDPEEQKAAVKEQTKGAGKSATAMAGKVLSGITSVIAGIIITLVFTFLLLYNKEKYENFFLKLYKHKDPEEVKSIVRKITQVAQQYLIGRAMSITIIFVLYAIGLSLVGIKNAIILAGIAALLTVVPYVGSILGGLFPVLMALMTEDSYQPALWSAVVLIFIQAMDNYFIEPNIVGGEVNVNALMSILSIMIGGLIWGVAGMVLFLPMFAIIKIICDHVEPLQPIGYLIGDTTQKKNSGIKEWFKSKFRK